MYVRTRDPRYVSLCAITEKQHGLFTAGQAASTGLTYEALGATVDRGRFEEVAPGVFRALPGAPLTVIERLHAAVLSAAALAARRSALALYDLAPHPAIPQLLVVRTRRNLDRAHIHSTRALHDDDHTVVDGIPTTSAIRATIDACGHLPRTLATRVVTKGVVKRRFRPDALLARPRSYGTLGGLAPTRRSPSSAISIRPSSTPGTISRHWSAMPRAASAYPTRCSITASRHRTVPATSTQPGREYRTVEYDGYWEHLTSTKRFDDDRVRQTELQELGWIIDRCTIRMLRKDGAAVFAGVVRAHNPGGP